MRELTLSANRANATIYTVDPARPGRRRRRRARTSIRASGAPTSRRRRARCDTWRRRPAASPIVNTNDFVGELKRIDAETSDYYVLGFYSSNPDPTKRTRAISVTVDRPDVTVASRRAYSLKTEGKLPAPPPLKPKK